MLTNHFYGKITLKMQVPDKFLSPPKSYLTQFDQKILKMRPPPPSPHSEEYSPMSEPQPQQ